MLGFRLLGALAAGLPGRVYATGAPIAAHTSATSVAAGAPTRIRQLDTSDKLPLSFERNQGQADKSVKFLAHAGGATVLLTQREIVLAGGAAPVRMRFVGTGTTPSIVGVSPLAGEANYLIGNDPVKWHTHVPTYARVQYQQLYRGMDVAVYGDRQQLEYDVVAAPGADVGAFRLRFAGVERLTIDAVGDLVVHTASGQLRHRKPIIYQESNGVRRQVSGGYVIRGRHEVGLRLAAYDTTQPVTIDPVLSYSTYLGADVATEQGGRAIAVGRDGSAYVFGETNSATFPQVNPLQPAPPLPYYVPHLFLVKLNPAGTALVFSTYFGGSGTDVTTAAPAIAIDRNDNILLTGTTGSTDFPLKNAYQTEINRGVGGNDIFVTKFDATGSLVYSTYLGGVGEDEGTGIAVDRDGNAYVTGSTSAFNPSGVIGNAPDFPTTPGAFQRVCGGSVDNGMNCPGPNSPDAIVAKFDPNGGLVYSTRLGGDGSDTGMGIAVDPDGAAYVVGSTNSQNDFPANGYQTRLAGGLDAFVAKVSPSGQNLEYLTHLGGIISSVSYLQASETPAGIAIDAQGNAYVVGSTSATDFPVTANSIQTFDTSRFPYSIGFLTKLDPTLTHILFSTFLGCIPAGVAVDRQGNATVAGQAVSPVPQPAFPQVQPLPFTVTNSSNHACVMTIDSTSASPLRFATYLGGTVEDAAAAVAVDIRGSIYLTGRTISPDFPTVHPVLTVDNSGQYPFPFVSKISGAVQLPPLGDADCDGSLTAADLIAMVRLIVKQMPPPCPSADTNGDGVLNQDDVSAVIAALFEPGS
jgi:hypothetical protein